MPWTGAAFLIGAAAISGLPPLNGFVSEFLIYFGAYQGVLSMPAASCRALLVIIAALALIGGLAAACFAKAFGVIFLGEPRRPHAQAVHEVGPAMLWPMEILAAACFLIGLAAPWGLARALPGILTETLRLPSVVLLSCVHTAVVPLRMVVVTASAFFAIMLALIAARRYLLAGRSVATAATWGCGFHQPSPQMQYTASSFAHPIVSLFRLPLRMPNVYEPCFRGGERFLKKFRWLQHGRVQLYVLYIMATLLVLMVWKLG
jgi:NADH:ubiquinone oxidoreductase subunit 5 (subunit L)/multisubunit Na+/H+ antiporter MnhA subunit